MNPYKILDLTPDASTDEIRQKYRSLAQQHHPDKGGDEELFKQIKLAYEILSDPERKKYYDDTGKLYTNSTIRSEAFSNITDFIIKLLPIFNGDQEDLILKLRIETTNLRTAVAQDISHCKRVILKVKTVQDRVKLKDKNGDNMIREILQGQINKYENDLEAMQHRQKVCDTMYKILEEYHYGIDDWILFIPKD